MLVFLTIIKMIKKMIRQNIDGRPIYSNEIWNKMLKIAGMLSKLGFIESYGKPNLFYKPIGEGAIFADLRGSEWLPLWEHSDLTLYFMDVPYWIFIKEVMHLQRAGCPISSFSEPPLDSYSHFYINTIPEGFCKTCGVDILPFIPWEKLVQSTLDVKIEIQYCNKCKPKVYEAKKIRREQKRFWKNITLTCSLCGSLEKKLISHHITYRPEEIIDVCYSCHGLIHKCTFPHYLWKQKRPPIPKGKKKQCRFCGRQHREDSLIYRSHRLCAIVVDKYSHEIFLKRKLVTLSNSELRVKCLAKIKRITKERERFYKHLTKEQHAQLEEFIRKVSREERYYNRFILEYM